MFYLRVKELKGKKETRHLFYYNSKDFYEALKQYTVEYKMYETQFYQAYHGLKIRPESLTQAIKEKQLIMEILLVQTKLQYKKCACEIKEDIYTLSQEELEKYLADLEWLWEASKWF